MTHLNPLPEKPKFVLTERIVFRVLLLIYGLVILFTFMSYGITPDEEAHVHYGNSVVNWYTSFFQERRILSWTNTWLYGGFYDTLSYLAVQIFPRWNFMTHVICATPYLDY